MSYDRALFLFPPYSIVSGYSDIKLESNKQYIFKEFWVKDKITMEIRKYFEENNEDKTWKLVRYLEGMFKL